ALGLVWMVFVYSTVLSFFGDMLQLSNAILATSVFRHIGQYPAEDISWAAVVTLVLIATALTAVGSLGFRRRALGTAYPAQPEICERLGGFSLPSLLLVEHRRIELLTSCLQSRCSTN